MKKKIIYIIILTALVSSLITVFVYWLINQPKVNCSNNKIIGNGDIKYEIKEITYNIPSFSLSTQGLYFSPIIKETIENLQTYEILADTSDDIYIYHNSYKGIKVKDIIELLGYNDYNKIIFKSNNGLQVTYLREDITDDIFFVFEKDDIKYPKDKEVNLLNPLLSSSYNINNIKTIYFE